MNFLQLAQRAAIECGSSGTLTTTANQPLNLARIVNWVSDTWNELQAMRSDWDWMRSSNLLGGGVSFVPTVGQFNAQLGTGAGQLGIAVDNFGKWDETTFRCYTTSNSGVASGAIGFGAIGSFAIGIGGIGGGGASPGIDPSASGEIGSGAIGSLAIGVSPIPGGDGGGGFFTPPSLDEIPLDPVDFDWWRDAYMRGPLRNVRTRPVVIAFGPDQSLCIGPPSNGNYTITGDYWVAPTAMVNDTDVPVGLPTRWHMLLVYGAMIKYGYFQAASDVLQRGQFEWGKMIRQLEERRLPRMYLAGALA